MGGRAARIFTMDKKPTYEELEQRVRELTEELAQRNWTAGMLWRSRETFARAFEENPDALVLVRSSDGTIMDVNLGFTKFLQFTPEEAVGKSPEELHNWVDAKERKAFLNELRENGQCTGMEARFRAKDGNVVHGLISAWPVEITGESCLMTITRDLSDGKKAEDLLRVQRDLGIALMDARSLKHTANIILNASSKVHGVDCGGVYVMDDLYGSLELVAHKGLPRRFVRSIARFEEDSPVVRMVLARKPVYGLGVLAGEEEARSQGLLCSAAIPVEFEGGVVACLYLASRSLDHLPERTRNTIEAIAARLGSLMARLKTEEHLVESEDRFATFMDLVPGNMFMKDENGCFLYVNRYMQETFGRKRWVGRRPHKLFGMEAARNWVDGDDRAMTEGIQEIVETLPDKNGAERVYRTFKFPIFREGKPGMLGGIGVEITKQVQAEKALRKTLQQVMAIFNTFPGGIKVVDTEHNIVDLSERLVWMYGLPGRKWAIGKKCYEVMKARSEPCPYCSVPQAVTEDRMVTRYMEPGDHGTESQAFKVYTHPIKDENGKTWGALECVMDVSDLKEAERKLRLALKEKELLLREVHHRVKNNMQVISTLLALQSLQLSDEQAKKAFENTRSRIRSMALAHEILYRDENIGRVDLALYGTRLVQSLFEAHGAMDRGIGFELDAGGISFGVDQAVPCGMVVNEIITNSLKHAFPNGGPGIIRLGARFIGEGVVEIVIEDNGIGLPGELRPGQAKTLGMDLIHGLVESQLNGTVIVHSGRNRPGTSFTLRFDANGPG